MTAGPTAGWSVALAAGAELGERPVWDDGDGAGRPGSLVWVDIHAGALHRYRPPDDDTSRRVGTSVGAAGLRTDGGLIAATDGGFAFLDATGRPDADPVDAQLPDGVSFNDGACDPAGRFLAGTSSVTGLPHRGSLYALDPDRRLRVLLEGVGESNGLAWSPDGGTLYYVDSHEPVIRRYAYDPASGALGPRSADLAVLPAGTGLPDGLVVDAAGAIWAAIWSGAAVHRYDPDGRLLARIDVPVAKPTCPGFGPPGSTTLYLTTAWEGLTNEERARQPWAGHLLVTDVGEHRGAVAPAVARFRDLR